MIGPKNQPEQNQKRHNFHAEAPNDLKLEPQLDRDLKHKFQPNVLKELIKKVVIFMLWNLSCTKTVFGACFPNTFADSQTVVYGPVKPPVAGQTVAPKLVWPLLHLLSSTRFRPK